MPNEYLLPSTASELHTLFIHHLFHKRLLYLFISQRSPWICKCACAADSASVTASVPLTVSMGHLPLNEKHLTCDWHFGYLRCVNCCFDPASQTSGDCQLVYSCQTFNLRLNLIWPLEQAPYYGRSPRKGLFLWNAWQRVLLDQKLCWLRAATSRPVTGIVWTI